MKNNNMKQFVIAIITVVALIAIVGGSTFAYFQWTTNETQRTNVNVTIKAGGITMTITQNDGALETSGLRPVANCDNSKAYMDAQVTIVNSTGTLAVPSFRLEGKIEPTNGDMTTDIASHIHYSVVPITALGATPAANECSTLETIASKGDLGHENEATTPTGTFANVGSVTKNGSSGWVQLLSGTTPADHKFLSRTYSSGVADGISFVGNKLGSGAGTNQDTTTAYFRVYVWIDSSYVHTNVGDTNTDPLQNAQIYLKWSETSIVEQVAD